MVRSKTKFALIGNAAAPIVNFRAPLMRSITARGHELYAFAPDYDDRSREQVRALGAIPVDYYLSRTGLNPISDLKGAGSLYRKLISIGAHTVLSFGIKPAIYGTLAANWAGVPARHVLITGLGYAFTEGGTMSIKRRAVSMSARILYRHALRHAHTVFTQNPDDAADFARMSIVGSEKLVTVNGTGVELDKWPPVPPVKAPVTFLLAARMLRDKGVFEFVEAARRIKTRHPETRFVLVGGLDTNPEAITADQLGAWVDKGIVEWPGHVDMKSWLAQTSVFVLPSYREGVPRSTQEAMAMARPVITTDAPGCRETVIEGINGHLVPPRESASLAEAMERFISEPHLIAQMGAESRRLAEERFDVGKVNSVMIATMGL